MKSYGIRLAKQNLGEIVREVRRGRQVVITNRGTPVARVVPMPAAEEPLDLFPHSRHFVSSLAWSETHALTRAARAHGM